MLIECSECNQQISDAATSCPRCGHPLADGTTPAQIVPGSSSNSPIFLIVASIALFVSLFAPMFLLFFPLMISLGCAVASLIRKEAWRPAAIGVLIAGVLLLVAAGAGGSSRSASTANLKLAKITDWNWRADPTFGTSGTIKWNVTVQNKSDRPMRLVKVDFTTYDKQEKLITTTFTFVHAIPPGGSRSENSFADLYGTEDKATIQVTDVTYSD